MTDKHPLPGDGIQDISLINLEEEFSDIQKAILIVALEKLDIGASLPEETKLRKLLVLVG